MIEKPKGPPNRDERDIGGDMLALAVVACAVLVPLIVYIAR